MKKKKIFIIEDEEEMLKLLSYKLDKEGAIITCFTSGIEALKAIDSQNPDLILLDIMLPDIYGLEICRKIKNNPNTKNIPIIMLTARNSEFDIVNGLNIGADDYITKPFSPRILVARINASLRKYQNQDNSTSIIHIQDMQIDSARFEVLIKRKPVNLTSSQFQILYKLASNVGQVFSRNQIINTIHGIDYDVCDRSIDLLIGRLRKKLGPYADYIETIYRVGYRFKESIENNKN